MRATYTGGQLVLCCVFTMYKIDGEMMKPMKPMEPMQPMAPMHPTERWWPGDLGDPGTSGAQSGMRYAFFPDRRRLVIERSGALSTYETGDHLIGGVSQMDSGKQTLEFTSQLGPVNLHELKQVDG